MSEQQGLETALIFVRVVVMIRPAGSYAPQA